MGNFLPRPLSRWTTSCPRRFCKRRPNCRRCCLLLIYPPTSTSTTSGTGCPLVARATVESESKFSGRRLSFSWRSTGPAQRRRAPEGERNGQSARGI
ncbi:hypothetical protein [Ornithinimicrobium kibberense]|uniref:hypothetical protein n=1 Tax=Ornithinimicrobium kibberense TaxID=282060 RepID=UPI00360EBB89